MTLEEKLTAAEARIAELESQLEGERTSITALNQRVTEAESARNEESALNGQLQGELKTLRQQHTDATAKIAKLEAEAKTAEAKAAEICASVGVEPLPVTPQGDRDASDLAEQLKAQKSPAEQTAFWRKHKDRILNRK
jgi:chromosome segregation ATPase